MTQFKWSSLSFTQKFLDLSVLVGALAASAWILQPEMVRLSAASQQITAAYLCFLAILLAGWNLCLSSLALYSSRRLARWRDDLADVMRAVGLCTLTLAALAQVFVWDGATRGLLLTFWPLASIWLFAWRLLKRVALRKVRLRGRTMHHVII